MIERSEILSWLMEQDRENIGKLRENVDELRNELVGKEVHLRALIEISNYCTNTCKYCGLRFANKVLPRYRMRTNEILDTVAKAVKMNFKTVVLQSGMDPTHSAEWVSDLVLNIKDKFDVTIALSLGERRRADYELWRKAGADRYLLRFETSDLDLFESLHDKQPTGSHPRLSCLKHLRELGYEVGSGVMVGLPGQNMESLADDILLFHKLDLDMIGMGPFIGNPATPLYDLNSQTTCDQIPKGSAMAIKAMALARLVCPYANIPATTAIEADSGEEARLQALNWGANVLMPDLTPELYRRHYAIYPSKTEILEYTKNQHDELLATLAKNGRSIGKDHGTAKSYLRRHSF